MSGLNKVIPMYVYRTQKVLRRSYNFYPASFLRWKSGQVRCFGTFLSDKFKYRKIPISLSKHQIVKSSIRLFSDDTNPAAKNVQKALEDEEFKKMLKDFSKDFDVTDDNAAVLKDIREKGEAPSDERPDSDPAMSTESSEALEVYHAIHKERFKEFDDKDSGIIYSYEEEQQLDDQNFFHIDQEYDSHVRHEVKRGVTGVYDIEELIPILREERLFDISVVEIPDHLHYADYIVLATAKSLRHARAVTEFILKFYKMKKGPRDPFIRIEGEKLGNWKAMDMGNIVLHVFLEDIREVYDIESLWLLDRKYDSGGNLEHDEVIDIMQDELDFMNCLKTEETAATEQETK